MLTNYLANTLKLSNYKVNMSFEEVYSILSGDLLQNKVPELNIWSGELGMVGFIHLFYFFFLNYMTFIHPFMSFHRLIEV